MNIWEALGTFIGMLAFFLLVFMTLLSFDG